MKVAKPEIVVADASPMIGLAIIGALPWLEKLFREVLIPDAVAAELRLESDMPGAKALADARKQGWLKMVSVIDIPSNLLATVDGGEAAAITLAKQKRLPLLIDESRGRVAARSEGVRIFGSGAVLLKAKERQIIRHVQPHLDALTRAHYRLSEQLRREILRLAGETAIARNV